MDVIIKKRSLYQRIIRLPKLIKSTWKFSKNGNLLDRIRFTFSMCLIVLK